MSRIKGLKGDPNSNINLYDLFSVFSVDNKSKYTELFIRIFKKTNGLKNYSEEVKKKLNTDFNIQTGELNDFSIIVLGLMVDNLFNKNDIKDFIKFCEYNEKRLIKNNDLQTYDNFEKISSEVTMVEISLENSELEKQTRILFKDDEWVILRPLTFEASKKYGNNTKWCTTMEKYPIHFHDYSNRGILIYCINKVTNYRVAIFYALSGTKEFSFWDVLDDRIDSMETELPDEILDIIMTEVKDKKALSNSQLNTAITVDRSSFLLANGRVNNNGRVINVNNTPPTTLSEESETFFHGLDIATIDPTSYIVTNTISPITYADEEED